MRGSRKSAVLGVMKMTVSRVAMMQTIAKRRNLRSGSGSHAKRNPSGQRIGSFSKLERRTRRCGPKNERSNPRDLYLSHILSVLIRRKATDCFDPLSLLAGALLTSIAGCG